MDASVRHDHVLIPATPLHRDAFRSSPATMSQSDKNTKQYWYPNMGNVDIIDALDGWGLSITHHQLVKPTPEFVLNVYCACLEKVVGLSEDSLQESVQSALSSLDEPNTVRGFGQPLDVSSLCSRTHTIPHSAPTTSSTTCMPLSCISFFV
jgi:hypothetical protein